MDTDLFSHVHSLNVVLVKAEYIFGSPNIFSKVGKIVSFKLDIFILMLLVGEGGGIGSNT